ncbi:MAG: hypothetical protein JWN66_3908 [Sphingomonas bacterium]|jgi:hypothetical protein|uniref:hypothetical protein n=1 Tax=Sphingomonas bacterium TaxID=1895847 RepID=UPI00261F8C51|nr:hypothetical protein [Sphingomonas bacterium]MDB5706792.1 hypothetical protein [Sphingomonas bacterium]
MTQPRTYTAPHSVYTGGVLYKPGQPFTTDEPRGAEWAPVDAAEKPATIASKPAR